MCGQKGDVLELWTSQYFQIRSGHPSFLLFTRKQALCEHEEEGKRGELQLGQSLKSDIQADNTIP